MKKDWKMMVLLPFLGGFISYWFLALFLNTNNLPLKILVEIHFTYSIITGLTLIGFFYATIIILDKIEKRNKRFG